MSVWYAQVYRELIRVEGWGRNAVCAQVKEQANSFRRLFGLRTVALFGGMGKQEQWSKDSQVPRDT